MREIDFRAWDEDLKEMYYLQRGEFHIGGRGANTFTNEWIHKLIVGGFVENGFHKPKILMQYIGLKDKNGVKIFEGDIVRILYTDWPSKSNNDKRTLEQYKKDLSKIGYVKYFPPEFALQFNGFSDTIFEGKHGEKEVIGNKFQNPELLEVKDAS